MKITCMTGAAAVLLLAASIAQADDDKFILQMASCQESWLDWKQQPAKVKEFTAKLESNFKMDEQSATFVPTRATSVLGHNISRVYPESVGMGVGFSVLLDASFDAIKASFEKQTGKRFGQCATEDGMKSCEHKVGEKKTVILMEGSTGKNAQSLIGCYYFYAK